MAHRALRPLAKLTVSCTTRDRSPSLRARVHEFLGRSRLIHPRAGSALHAHSCCRCADSTSPPLQARAADAGLAASASAAASRRSISATAPSLQLTSESFLNGTSSVYVEEMFRAWTADPKR